MTTANLTKDPITGMYNLSPGASDNPTGSRTIGDLGIGGNAGSTPATDTTNGASSKFVQGLMQILSDAQKGSQNQNAPLLQAREQMNNQALNESNPLNGPLKDIFAGATPEGALAGRKAIQAAWAPGINSINDQMQLNNENTTNNTNYINAAINGANTAYNMVKPTTLSPGQTLSTQTGLPLLTTPNYESPRIRPDNGNLDSFDTANHTWASEVVNGATNGATSIAENNNPLNIKATSTTMKMFEAMSPSTGSKATDGGNFLMFSNPTDGIKAARMLLQSSLYANDSVDQAMSAWSGGGYNSNIVAGTGINPHALIKDLDPVQMDALITSMRKEEGGTLNQGVGGAQSGSGAPVADPKGNTFSPQYQTRVAQLPPALQKYVLAGPAGVAYIDGDATKAVGIDTTASIYGSKTGIPVLNGSDKQMMSNVNNIAQTMQTMQQLVNTNLKGSGTPTSNPITSWIENSGKSIANQAIHNSPDLDTFNAYVGNVTTAVSNLKALAGGSGSGLRITGAEIGGITDSLPQQTDSWQTAQNKIDAVNLKIAQMFHTSFPDTNPNWAVLPQSQAGQQAPANSGRSSGTSVISNGVDLSKFNK